MSLRPHVPPKAPHSPLGLLRSYHLSLTLTCIMHAHPACTPHYPPLVSLVCRLVANAPLACTSVACTAVLLIPFNCATVNGIFPGNEFHLCCWCGMPTCACSCSWRWGYLNHQGMAGCPAAAAAGYACGSGGAHGAAVRRGTCRATGHRQMLELLRAFTMEVAFVGCSLF